MRWSTVPASYRSTCGFSYSILIRHTHCIAFRPRPERRRDLLASHLLDPQPFNAHLISDGRTVAGDRRVVAALELEVVGDKVVVVID